MLVTVFSSWESVLGIVDKTFVILTVDVFDSYNRFNTFTGICDIVQIFYSKFMYYKELIISFYDFCTLNEVQL